MGRRALASATGRGKLVHMSEAPITIDDPDLIRELRIVAEGLGISTAAVARAAVRRGLDANATRPAKATRDPAQIARLLSEIDALPHVGAPLTDRDLYGADGLPL
ncbi:MAG: hypothetical protein KJS97_13545 [Alphaproteobacteria bacterium]|nr:hypothetical protein [Alphaproteobacteria bacterium]